MATRTKNVRAAAPVRFAPDDIEDFDAPEGGDEDVMDMLSIMQELQKKKNAKASNRNTAFLSKKNALIAGARKEAETMAREGRAYMYVFRHFMHSSYKTEFILSLVSSSIFFSWLASFTLGNLDIRAHIPREQCKTRIEEMRSQESATDELMKDAMRMWSAHEESYRGLLAIYPELIEDLSPQRARDVNAASEMLETHPLAREASRRRLMKNARKNMEAGIENQKLATDASALIKHYKALLLI